MQPAARISAAIEILTDIVSSIRSDGPPADRCVASYMRQRRYIGSKDRRAILNQVYRVVRRYGLLSWVVKKAEIEVTARSLMIAELSMDAASELEHFGADGPYAPTGLSEVESELRRLARSSKATDAIKDAPSSATYELPSVAEEGFQKRFGEALPDAMASLNQEAPLGLRLNPLKADFNLFINFKKEFQNIEINKYSPIGVSSNSNLPLQNIAAYRDGWIEVQDEAAQLASYLVDVQPDMSVVDLCAGAGGKSLLLAALMKNQGIIQACDVGDRRLGNLTKRAERAGATIINTHVLDKSGAGRAKKLADFYQQADRVLVDAPCSGTGTWRRNPDQRWRLTHDQVDQYSQIQLRLLNEATELVSRNGRLVYMTCSLLPQENERVVDGFLELGGWRLLHWQSVWAQVLPDSPVPTSLSTMPECLQLAPHAQGTDGFFTAVFERIPA